MRTRNGWLALLLTTGVALAPTLVRGQDVPFADPQIPLPLGHDRLEKGGLFTGMEFMFFKQTNPIKHQVIAQRGILDFDGSISADLNGIVVPIATGTPIILPGDAAPGTFLGSGVTALDAEQTAGPSSYQPGFRLTTGWRFNDGRTIEFSWMTLTEAKFSAVATLVPPTLQPGTLFTETFLFSPVVNFPNDFAGPRFKVALGNPLAAYGIWNGAAVETISFTQRYTQYDIGSRIPVFETDFCRCYGLVGVRHVSLWERFAWRTVAQNFAGVSGQDDVANYNNIVSNQMYGVDIGIGSEWYIGRGFSISLDGRAAGMVDIVHEIARYVRSDFAIGNKRAKRDYSVVPELEGQVNVWWYPWEGVQIRVGYDFMNFFNTVSSPQPVSFDYSALTPAYDKHTYRYIEGFNVGIGFIW